MQHKERVDDDQKQGDGHNEPCRKDLRAGEAAGQPDKREGHEDGERGQHLHAVAGVVVGVRVELRNKDGHRAVGDGVDVERKRQPQQERGFVGAIFPKPPCAPQSCGGDEPASLPGGGVDLGGSCVKHERPCGIVPSPVLMRPGRRSLAVDFLGGVWAAHEVQPVMAIDVVVLKPCQRAGDG